jgi:hypothetical protein
MNLLSTGVQDFTYLRESNYIYVDKTKEILDFISEGKYMFFSRPRRFGKSLLCSTLRCIYEGKKELFEGLYLYDKIDWEKIKQPVIYLDFSQIAFSEIDIQEAVLSQIVKIGEEFGISMSGESPGKNLNDIFYHFEKQKKRVVVIIDEYDKALTDVLGDEVLFNKHRNFLRGFYGILKPNDKNIHKVFLTGVSKYGKISVFSTLNNITDYTLFEKFATLCGYTREELEFYFDKELQEVSVKFGMSREKLLAAIKARYNGYSFDGVSKVYNPYSILNFLQLKMFRNFWFDTGTPYFLIEMLAKQNVTIDDLEKIKMDVSVLDAADIEHESPISLLFQTGYLTIKQAIFKNINLRYILDFPNTEVRQAFSQYILVTYMNSGLDKVSTYITNVLQDAFDDLDFQKIIDVLKTVYSSIPYSLYDRKEAYFHTIFHVVMNTVGLPIESEVQTNIGRIDSVIKTDENIFIFEFKLDESEEVAIGQIKENLYFQKYVHENLPIYLIGINFSSIKKNIAAYRVEKVKFE